MLAALFLIFQRLLGLCTSLVARGADEGLCGAGCVSFGGEILRLEPQNDRWRVRFIRWPDASTPPSASLSMTDGGCVGWW